MSSKKEVLKLSYIDPAWARFEKLYQKAFGTLNGITQFRKANCEHSLETLCQQLAVYISTM